MMAVIQLYFIPFHTFHRNELVTICIGIKFLVKSPLYPSFNLLIDEAFG
jgi:hypothetical protein